MIWDEVQLHFSFPKGTNLANVRTWALQKGAIAFQSYKKRLNKDYIKKGLAPDFTKKGLPKLRDHWDSFVQYKQSLEAVKMIETNTINTSKERENFISLGLEVTRWLCPNGIRWNMIALHVDSYRQL
jgi:hypothetical protein